LWNAVIRDELESKNLLYTIDEKEQRLQTGDKDVMPADTRKKVDNAAARALIRANLSPEQARYVAVRTQSITKPSEIRLIHYYYVNRGLRRQFRINLLNFTPSLFHFYH